MDEQPGDIGDSCGMLYDGRGGTPSIQPEEGLSEVPMRG
jgi:hypothetical protein